MKNPALLALLTALLAGAAAPAAAQSQASFDALAASAVRLDSAERLARLFWSQLVPCAAERDLERRQCEGIRATRREKVAASTFLLAAEDAVALGSFNQRAMSVDVDIRACVACQGVEIAGARRYLVGRGDVKVAGDRVLGHTLRSATRTFSSVAEGRAWMQNEASRLVSELLVRIPDPIESWKEGGAEGHRVEVVGFRVSDPCTGEVLWANPPAADLSPDPEACTQGAAGAAPVPDKVGQEDVRAALAPAVKRARGCFRTYGVPGTATFTITFGPDGAITELSQEGDFIDTPTGACLRKAVARTRFPASKRAKTRIRYPIVLR
jgi:hypothetical protein